MWRNRGVPGQAGSQEILNLVETVGILLPKKICSYSSFWFYTHWKNLRKRFVEVTEKNTSNNFTDNCVTKVNGSHMSCN